MKSEIVQVLRCPVSHSRLRLVDGRRVDEEITAGTLVSADGAHRYPIRDGVPRFVQDDDYATSFGFQWNKFRQTQLDSHSGLPISADRFYSFSEWRPEELEGRRVLDAGCGAGRFTEVALAAGAEVIAVDYSSAVDACWENHRGHPRLNVVQADIYRLPFAPESFDYVYCFGVLQHTPNVCGAFLSLPPQLRPGGKLAVDLYPRMALNLLWPKYWLRPFTKRLRKDRLFRIVERAVPLLLPVSRALQRVPRFGRKLRYLVPVANYEAEFPLTRTQLYEWAVLDTFDALASEHDQPQSAAALREGFLYAGMVDIEIDRPGFLVGRGRRPIGPRDRERPGNAPLAAIGSAES